MDVLEWWCVVKREGDECEAMMDEKLDVYILQVNVSGTEKVTSICIKKKFRKTLSFKPFGEGHKILSLSVWLFSRLLISGIYGRDNYIHTKDTVDQERKPY